MNALPMPRPLAADDETVTFRRTEWDAYASAVEDAADLAAARRIRAEIADVGIEEVIRLGYTADETERLIDGHSPITIRRERAGMNKHALATAAGISRSYLSEIEGGKKPGSLLAMGKIAKVLNVPVEALIP